MQTRAHENLDSWDAWLLRPIPKLVGELFRSQEEMVWFSAFAVKVIGEAIEGLSEELLPVKMLLQGFAEIGQHAAERQLEEAKEEMADQVAKRIRQERDGLKKNADKYIDGHFEKIRAVNQDGCGEDVQLLQDSIDKFWPPMTAEKLDEAEAMIHRIVIRLQEEENNKKRLELYEECKRIELERPGGIPSDSEVTAAEKKCSDKAESAFPP